LTMSPKMATSPLPTKPGRGRRVLLELMEPRHQSDCLITSNAYFASMEAALAKKEKGLTFNGNVNKCSKQFPIKFLGNTTLPQQGSQAILASIDKETGETELVAISWVDRNQRFLWRQLAELERGGTSSVSASTSWTSPAGRHYTRS
jgi:hypothetical protein